MASANMSVRIFKRSKTATQSGRGNTRHWVLEHEPTASRSVDRLMGWTSSHDTSQQISLVFSSQEQAIAFAERNRLDYWVVPPQERKRKRKSYAENFRYNKVS